MHGAENDERRRCRVGVYEHVGLARGHGGCDVGRHTRAIRPLVGLDNRGWALLRAAERVGPQLAPLFADEGERVLAHGAFEGRTYAVCRAWSRRRGSGGGRRAAAHRRMEGARTTVATATGRSA